MSENNKNESVVTLKNTNKEAKLNLHRIEGFNPELELNEIKILDEYGNVTEKRYYLPLATKETWFWLRFPDGAIRTRTLQVTENYVKAECRLYRHYKDAENEYFVSAEKIVNIDYLNPFYYGRGKEEIIGGYVNSAKASAESIALTKGGFGIQIESPEESGLLSDKSYEESVKKIPVPKTPAAKVPGQNVGNNTIPVPKKADEDRKKEMDKKLCEQKGGNTFVPFSPEDSENVEPNVPFIHQKQESDSGKDKKEHQKQELKSAKETKTVSPKQNKEIKKSVMKQPAKADYEQQNLFSVQENEELVGHGDTVIEKPKVANTENETEHLESARNFVVSSSNPKFNQKTLGEIFDTTPFAVPYIAHNSEGEQRDAAILLSRSNPETNAKLEQFLGR